MVIPTMKKTLLQRFGALALCAMMAFGLMATPAMAADDGDGKLTLTINNVIKDTEYKIYKVLSLDYEASQAVTEGTEARRATYAYTYAEGSKDALKKILDGGYGLVQENGNYKVELNENGKYVSGMRGYDKNGDKSAAYFTLNDTHLVFQLMVKPDGATAYRLATDQEYADWSESNFGKQFAADFGNALRNAITGIAFTGAPVETVRASADNGSLSVQLDPGYYLIDSGSHRRVMTGNLFAGGTNEINEKNSKPTLEKKVLLDNGENQYGKENDKGVGDLVHYRVEINTGAGVTGLKFTDTLSDGLTFVSLDSIQFFGRNEKGEVTAPVWDRDWTDDKNAEGKDDIGCDLVVETNREMYTKSDVGVKKRFVSLAAAGDMLTNGSSYHGFILDASQSNNVLEITFAKEWLTSKRGSTEDIKGTADNRNEFTEGPMTPNDPRLDTKENPGNAALFNQYVGDTTTTVDDGGIIVIYYTARINDKAKINDVGNPNGAHLDYSNDPEFDPDGTNPPWEPSNDDHTTTYVYVMDLLKHATDDENVKLQGAKFEVRKAGYDETKTDWLTVNDELNVTVPTDFAGKFDTTPNMKFVRVKLVDGKYQLNSDEGKTGPYRVATDDEIGNDSIVKVEELETNVNGQIEVIGLDSDLYRLKETVAPDGYIKMNKGAYVYVVIGGVESKKVETTGEGDTQTTTPTETVDRGSATVTAKVFVQDGEQTSNRFVKKNPAGMSIYAFGVENASGMKMPETGGIGTTIFYVVGGLLIVGAGVLLIVKKRVGNNEE